MKTNFLSLLCGVGLLGLLASCDNVAEPDRYIPYDKPDASKNILIQEFSGLTCVNCPNAATTLHEISDNLEGKAVIVAMFPYVPMVGEPLNGYDLSCDIANEIYSRYSSSLPAATFDGGRIQENMRRWSGLAATALAVPSPLNVEVTSSYDAASRKVKAHYTVNFVDNFEGELNVTLYLTENNVLADQKVGNTEEKDFPHDHVLRAGFNGTYGESIGSTFTFMQKLEGDYELTLKPEWNADNCNVVAFVSVPRGTVYNAAETPVKK